MLIIGLTGSIAMGKSTAALHLMDRGIPVFSADEAVHDLYEDEAVAPVGAAFPGVISDGKIDRDALSQILMQAPEKFKLLEQIVHPLVAVRRDQFLQRNHKAGTEMVALDIPLLFEKHLQDSVDVVLLMTADADIQRERILSRPQMSEEKLELILSRQMPDEQKREQAHFVIDSGGSFSETHAQLDQFLESVQDWPQTVERRLFPSKEKDQ